MGNRASSNKPIETTFKLPSPLPTWPPGEGFASGTIDLGGLEVCQVSSFTKIWVTQSGGPGNSGSTFFDPSSIPDGFFNLGSYCQPNSTSLYGWILCGKDVTNDPSSATLKPPVDYTLAWSSQDLKIKKDGDGYVWLPTPPDGYKPVGYVVTRSPEKPSLERIRCVRVDLTEEVERDEWLWGVGDEEDDASDENGFGFYGSRPRNRGIQGTGVAVNSFLAVKNGAGDENLACLKNVAANSSAMPNLEQIQALVQAYSPVIYCHPDEEYFPASVDWYFENGALLYQNANESNPVRIEPAGANLPQGGSNDGGYWLDLPAAADAGAERERVKRGDLKSAAAYLHVKPVFGSTFTDIVVLIFYPFNGPATATFVVDIPLGPVGEHVGDWEHLTLRVSNFDGELKRMYFAQHSRGTWVNPQDLEFAGGNKPAAYASYHGHASYPTTGLFLQGSGGVGLRNDAGKGAAMDTGAVATVVAAEYLGGAVVEPPWLNYMRKWGPDITYETGERLERLEGELGNLLRRLPREVYGEEGPTGPKVKDSWSGDERS